MFAVLVTHFAAVEQVHGPFATKQEAHAWAFQNLPEVYRVFEVLTPSNYEEGSQPMRSGTE